MEFEVRVPSISTIHTNGENPITISSKTNTLENVLESLVSEYPGLKQQLYSDGELHRHVNIFVDEEDFRFIGGLGLELTSSKQQITIIPAVAGG